MNMDTTTAIVEYQATEAVLADLAARYKGVVFPVETEAGMRDAKAAQKDIAQYRIGLEKARTKLKEDVLARGRLIDGEAKRLFSPLAALEDPIVDQIKREERRLEAEREAAIKAEQDRIAAEERAKKEAEQRALAEERAKNAAEAQRLADERAKLEAEERERRRLLAQEEAAAKARIAESEAKARAERAAEEERLRVERRRLEDEQRAREDSARRERLEAEAREREARREEEERQRQKQLEEQRVGDAYQCLHSFVTLAAGRKEFRGIKAEIVAFLSKSKK